MNTILGIDIGGSGSRLTLRATGHAHEPSLLEITGRRVSITGAGSDLAAVVEHLLHAAADEWPSRMPEIHAIGLGATGLGSLVSDPSAVTVEIRRVAALRGIGNNTLRAAVAIDAVTAHLGALRGESGAIVALGTGAIAIGGNGGDIWRRVDGWGHLLGDRGSGAAIGRTALAKAIETHDGVSTDGAALLAAARRRFGEPQDWPAQLYTRDDRAGVLASFAKDVAALASEDAAASRILNQAGSDAARSAIAALANEIAPRVALTGGIARSAHVVNAFNETVHSLRPDVQIVPTAGDPLAGAALLAEMAAHQRISMVNGYVWL